MSTKKHPKDLGRLLFEHYFSAMDPVLKAEFLVNAMRKHCDEAKDLYYCNTCGIIGIDDCPPLECRNCDLMSGNDDY